jgi:hypothetical protein
MKYHRGTGWELISRKPGMLNYATRVRRESVQAVYGEWFGRHWGKVHVP